ncbi:MAG: phage holin family protein [Lachnospiraceae bacterium]|nr:phage holin family protein [Lachnospiraceae bacterium]
MEKMKAIFTAVGGAILSWLGALAIPIILLVICNVLDYITGIVAAGYRAEKISSYKGFRGIAKKICMWLLVVVGAVMDELIAAAGASVGIVLPFSWAIAIVVAVWLTCNEIISILENISDIGVPMPGFVRRLAEYVASQVEKQGEDILPEDKGEK